MEYPPEDQRTLWADEDLDEEDEIDEDSQEPVVQNETHPLPPIGLADPLSCVICGQREANALFLCGCCNRHFCNGYYHHDSDAHIVRHILETGHTGLVKPNKQVVACADCGLDDVQVLQVAGVGTTLSASYSQLLSNTAPLLPHESIACRKHHRGDYAPVIGLVNGKTVVAPALGVHVRVNGQSREITRHEQSQINAYLRFSAGVWITKTAKQTRQLKLVYEPELGTETQTRIVGGDDAKGYLTFWQNQTGEDIRYDSREIVVRKLKFNWSVENGSIFGRLHLSSTSEFKPREEGTVFITRTQPRGDLPLPSVGDGHNLSTRPSDPATADRVKGTVVKTKPLLCIRVDSCYKRNPILKEDFADIHVLEEPITGMLVSRALGRLVHTPGLDIKSWTRLPSGKAAKLDVREGPAVPALVKISEALSEEQTSTFYQALLAPDPLVHLDAQPGTGKSEIITRMIHGLVHLGQERRDQGKILVVAPTNHVVDVLLKRLETIPLGVRLRILNIRSRSKFNDRLYPELRSYNIDQVIYFPSVNQSADASDGFGFRTHPIPSISVTSTNQVMRRMATQLLYAGNGNMDWCPPKPRPANPGQKFIRNLDTDDLDSLFGKASSSQPVAEPAASSSSPLPASGHAASSSSPLQVAGPTPAAPLRGKARRAAKWQEIKAAPPAEKHRQVATKRWLDLFDRNQRGEKLIHKDSYDFTSGRLYMEQFLIVDAQVIICCPHMYHAWAEKIQDAGAHVSALIVDEASAFTEAELLSLYTPTVRKTLLCGDAFQLGPCISAPNPTSRPSSWNVLAKNKLLGIVPRLSLRENFRVPALTLGVMELLLPEDQKPAAHPRLRTRWQEELPRLFLETENAAWASLDRHLRDGGATVFVRGREDRARASRVNDHEAQFIREVIEKIVECGETPLRDVGILTPYTGQKCRLREVIPHGQDPDTYDADFESDEEEDVRDPEWLSERYLDIDYTADSMPSMRSDNEEREGNALHIGVYDSFQGGQRPFVILSQVRAANGGTGLGFTRNANRQWMAISRASVGTLLVCDVDAFLKVPVVSAFIAVCKRTGRFYELRGKDLVHVPPIEKFETPRLKVAHPDICYMKTRPDGTTEDAGKPRDPRRPFGSYPPVDPPPSAVVVGARLAQSPPRERTEVLPPQHVVGSLQQSPARDRQVARPPAVVGLPPQPPARDRPEAQSPPDVVGPVRAGVNSGHNPPVRSPIASPAPGPRKFDSRRQVKKWAWIPYQGQVRFNDPQNQAIHDPNLPAGSQVRISRPTPTSYAIAGLKMKFEFEHRAFRFVVTEPAPPGVGHVDLQCRLDAHDSIRDLVMDEGTTEIRIQLADTAHTFNTSEKRYRWQQLLMSQIRNNKNEEIIFSPRNFTVCTLDIIKKWKEANH